MERTICLMGVAAGGGWSMVETIQGHGHPIGGETTGRLDFSDVSFLDELIRDVDYITWESFSASPWPDMERSFVYGRVRGFMDAMTISLSDLPPSLKLNLLKDSIYRQATRRESKKPVPGGSRPRDWPTSN